MDYKKNTVKINYQKKLDELIKKLNGEVKSIVLHSCCAPCSSYCVEYLSDYFDILVFFYNPNIFPRDEYLRRVEEQKSFIKNIKTKNKLDFIEGDYNTDLFYDVSSNRYNQEEGQEACENCYEFRLKETAILAKKLNYDYFATTLSISPHKDSQIINKIGEEIESKLSIKHLPSDFKKKNGFKRSIEISKNLGLYRQDYCGCVFSKDERDKRIEDIKEKASKNKEFEIIVTGCCDECRHREIKIVKRGNS